MKRTFALCLAMTLVLAGCVKLQQHESRAMNQGWRRHAEYLDVAAFYKKFEEEWTRTTSQFRKIESRANYHEPGDAAESAFRAGDLDNALSLLRQRIAEQAPLYEQAYLRGVKIVRLRIFSEPPSAYERYEWHGYPISASFGEQILAISRSRAQRLGLPEIRDMLIFDDRVALVHDYCDNDVLRGAWLVDSPANIQELLRGHDRLLEGAVDFDKVEGFP